jgi:hypothetical protein
MGIIPGVENSSADRLKSYFQKCLPLMFCQEVIKTDKIDVDILVEWFRFTVITLKPAS